MFSKKTQGIYVDLNDHTFTVARTTGGPGALNVEEVKACPANNREAMGALLQEIQPKRAGARNYLPASCAVYPRTQLIRRATIDPKRIRETGYLDETVASQCRISSDEYMLAVLSASGGVDVHTIAEPDKEVIFAGMSNADVGSCQERLLELGVFPENLELGSLSVLGALVDYLKFSKSNTPTLVLEIGEHTTQSYVISDGGLATSRPIPQGMEAMVPIIQKELGLKDEESARRLFTSNTFDFTGMAASFTKKLIKELQSSIGFYEVQTGQSIGQLICTLLPSKLSWLQAAVAGQLGVESLKIDYSNWLKDRKLSMEAATASSLDHASLGIVSLMLRN